MDPPGLLHRGREASTRRRRSYKTLLTLMLSILGIALQRLYPIIPQSPSYATPEGRPALAASVVIPYSLLFCFSASLISIVLSAHDEYRRASRHLQLLAFDSILLTCASLLSTILPPKLCWLPYILFAVFLVCSFWALLKWLYLRGREVGAFIWATLKSLYRTGREVGAFIWATHKSLYLRGSEMGAFSFFIRRLPSAHETPLPLGLGNV